MSRFARYEGNDKALRRRISRAAMGAMTAVAFLRVGSVPVEAQIPPNAEWRTLRTEHFAVTFQVHAEALGRRAAARAEAAWDALEPLLPDPGDERVELLIAEDADFSNGFATVSPARRIVVYARPPVDGFALAHFDDWLDLVITHELAHVFHLEASGGLGRLLRGVFGRVPAPWPFFPGLGTPGWTIEGLATWYESELTGWGRTRGTYFEMMLRAAALEGRFAPIDQASGESPQWPAGETAYLYGSLFFQHLLSRYGSGRMSLFVDAVAGQWIPYRLNAAAKDAFGISFSDAWRAWSDSVREASKATARSLASGPGADPELLTREGRVLAYPRGDGAGVVYARADGKSDPQLRRWEGESDRFLVRTHGLSHFDVDAQGGVVWAQLEFQDPFRVYADLWSRSAQGETRRITRGARLDQPTLHPDGETIVAVQTVGTRTRLVRLYRGGGEPLPLADQENEIWAFPAYSPDGRWIAATRWREGGADVVVLDAGTGQVLLEVTRDAALDLAPAWSPDGTELLWGSDRSGIPQIVASRVWPQEGRAGTVEAVTGVVTGAAFPAVDASGEWVYFSLYTAEGWELARVPFATGERRPSETLDRRFSRPRPERSFEPQEGILGDYDALGSLRPRFWEPLVLPGEDGPDGRLLGPFLGFSTAADDLVGRHEVALQGAVSLTSGRLDGRLQYAFAGFGNPRLRLSVEQEWDATGPFVAETEGGGLERLYIREREQRANVEVDFIRARWIYTGRLGLRAGLVWQDRELLDRTLGPPADFALRRPESRFAEGRATLSLSTARGHALSVSAEEGVSLFVLGRTLREQALADTARGVAGLDGSVDELLSQLQLYQSFPGPGFGDHVLALRGAFGAARGPGADGLTFEVGGARGAVEALTGLSLFGGTGYFFPVRGYENGERTGRYAWTASAEYRFPLLMVNRGLGLAPVHVDRLHGAFFADGGHAWGSVGGLPASGGEPIWSGGVELSARLTALFRTRLHLRGGWAWTAVDAARLGTSRFYLRLGANF